MNCHSLNWDRWEIKHDCRVAEVMEKNQRL